LLSTKRQALVLLTDELAKSAGAAAALRLLLSLRRRIEALGEMAFCWDYAALLTLVEHVLPISFWHRPGRRG
jgi:hypothetical protein